MKLSFKQLINVVELVFAATVADTSAVDAVDEVDVLLAAFFTLAKFVVRIRLRFFDVICCEGFFILNSSRHRGHLQSFVQYIIIGQCSALPACPFSQL